MTAHFSESDLEWEKWDFLKENDRGPGVYAIFDVRQQRLRYVGHTRECWERIRAHRRTGFTSPDFEIRWLPASCKVVANAIEYAVIAKHKPMMNSHGYKKSAQRLVQALGPQGVVLRQPTASRRHRA
jgi:hypothetical protein